MAKYTVGRTGIQTEMENYSTLQLDIRNGFKKLKIRIFWTPYYNWKTLHANKNDNILLIALSHSHIYNWVTWKYPEWQLVVHNYFCFDIFRIMCLEIFKMLKIKRIEMRRCMLLFLFLAINSFECVEMAQNKEKNFLNTHRILDQNNAGMKVY